MGYTKPETIRDFASWELEGPLADVIELFQSINNDYKDKYDALTLTIQYWTDDLSISILGSNIETEEQEKARLDLEYKRASAYKVESYLALQKELKEKGLI